MSWGTWEEDRRYPSKDGEHVIVVSKRVNGDGKTFWKNERRALPRLTRADRAYYEGRRSTMNPLSFAECGCAVPPEVASGDVESLGWHLKKNHPEVRYYAAAPVVLEGDDLELVSNVLGELVEGSQVNDWPNAATVERLRLIVEVMDEALSTLEVVGSEA